MSFIKKMKQTTNDNTNKCYKNYLIKLLYLL